MKTMPEVGDIIILKEFSFNNKAGGTGMSNWKYNETYAKPVKVKVTKEWEDYECGQMGWGVPVKSDKGLIAYLERNSREQIVYWSEFDIIKK